MRERKTSATRFPLGDLAEKALSSVGVTSERVEAWLGRPCNCKARREKLNRWGAWLARVVSGETEDAAKHLDDMMGDDGKGGGKT